MEENLNRLEPKFALLERKMAMEKIFGTPNLFQAAKTVNFILQKPWFPDD